MEGIVVNELQSTNIYVFGDGLSDMGHWGVLTENRYPPSPPLTTGAGQMGQCG